MQAWVQALRDDGLAPSVTTDIWSDRDGRSFMSFEMHGVSPEFRATKCSLGCMRLESESHTAVELRTRLRHIYYDLLQFTDDPTAPVMKACITTDQGSNITAAVDTDASGFFWMKCALHFLHNGVKHALKQDDTFNAL